jgi:hypothetical protein
MISADSRYASAAQLTHTAADGEQLAYLIPRLLPPPESFSPVLTHRVTDSDRLDLIAWKNLGNPQLSWRIADANRAMHPGALPGAPGDTLVVPVAGSVGA